MAHLVLVALAKGGVAHDAETYHRAIADDTAAAALYLTTPDRHRRLSCLDVANTS